MFKVCFEYDVRAYKRLVCCRNSTATGSQFAWEEFHVKSTWCYFVSFRFITLSSKPCFIHLYEVNVIFFYRRWCFTTFIGHFIDLHWLCIRWSNCEEMRIFFILFKPRHERWRRERRYPMLYTWDDRQWKGKARMSSDRRKHRARFAIKWWFSVILR